MAIYTEIRTLPSHRKDTPRRSLPTPDVPRFKGVQEGEPGKAEGLPGRDLSEYDLKFLDGEAFGNSTMVVTLGVTVDGDKVWLAFVKTETEKAALIAASLSSLTDRGLDLSPGSLAGI